MLNGSPRFVSTSLGIRETNCDSVSDATPCLVFASDRSECRLVLWERIQVAAVSEEAESP